MATCTQETKSPVYECHPAANIFPMMDEESFAALKADIKANGLKEPGKLYFDQVIDGRNRYKACQELGIEMEFWELDESDETFDPVAYVLSHNLHRRHLTESQRSMIAGKLAKLKLGQAGNGRKVEVSIDTPTLEQAADMLNVGRASVARAKQVLDAGSPEIIQAVEAGQLPVSFAAKFVTEEDDKRTQSKLWKQGGKDALKKHITEPSPYVEDDTEATKRPAKKKTQDDGIDLAEFLRHETGKKEGVLEMLSEVPGDGWELLEQSHPGLSERLAKVCDEMSSLLRSCEAVRNATKELEFPSDAMRFAEYAILQLQRIQPTDIKRAEALRRIRDWIDENSDNYYRPPGSQAREKRKKATR